MTALDQIFVNLKHWILVHSFWPESFTPLVSIILSILPILGFFPLLFGITTILERKGLARIQNRLGPNRVGLPFTKTRLFGFGQFIADGVKMLTKEDIVPHAADQVVHFLAPVVLIIPVFLAFSVLPFGRNMIPIDLDGGVLFFFAVGAATELSIFMAGWSSSNKYSLLGAMRAIAQMISYELPLVIASVPVIMMTGTLSTVTIVNAQTGPLFGFLHPWHVFTPWGLAGFILFLVAAAAESNRTPFDLPEAESELVAGYFTEYSGFKFALFFLGEYLGLFAVSGMAITLFLGGWLPPFTFLDFIPSWLCFVVKLLGFVTFFIWLRGTLPRLRTDQLMSFAWKFMLPMVLINILVTAVWHLSIGIPGGLLARWLLCALLIWLPYMLLGRSFEATISKRVYRYAE
jgi:NADH-quinone oxidoreductase subunit H